MTIQDMLDRFDLTEDPTLPIGDCGDFFMIYHATVDTVVVMWRGEQVDMFRGDELSAVDVDSYIRGFFRNN